MKKARTELFNQLKIFGLSDKETILYLTVLSNGPATASNLAKAASLKRPTVYVLLESLKQKGLVALTKIKGKQFFKISSLEKFKDLIEIESAKIDRQKKSIQNFLGELKSFQQAGKESGAITYFEGDQGIFTIFQKVVESGQDPFFIGSSKMLVERYSDQRWIKMISGPREQIGKSRSKIITDQSTLTQKRLAESPSPFRQLKLLPADFTTQGGVVIFGDYVALISFTNYPFGVLVESKTLADLMRFMFESNWAALS